MTSRSRVITKDSMLQKVQYAAEGNDEDICGGKKQHAENLEVESVFLSGKYKVFLY